MTSAPSAANGKTKCILVVDDEPAMRSLVAATLETAGHRVKTADDGEAAWQLLVAADFDLLVTDHFMPKMSGLALVQRVRLAQRPLPVIVISGTLEPGDVPDEPWSRIDIFIPKPFSREQLLAATHRLLFASGGAAVSQAG